MMKIDLQYTHLSNTGFASRTSEKIVRLLNPTFWAGWIRNRTSSGPGWFGYSSEYRRINVWPFSLWF